MKRQRTSLSTDFPIDNLGVHLKFFFLNHALLLLILCLETSNLVLYKYYSIESAVDVRNTAKRFQLIVFIELQQ